MPKFKIVTGIVLRHIEYGEAEKMFIIITPTGKVKAFAKGVRKVTSKSAGHLEIFSHANIQLVDGNSGRHIITTAVAIERFDGITYDIEKFALGMFACEIVDLISTENEDDNTYHHLLIILKALRDTTYNKNFVLFILAHLSIISGIYPSLEQCVICGQDATPEHTLFSQKDGGIVCNDCKRETETIQLSLKTVKVLRNTYRHTAKPMTYDIDLPSVASAAEILFKFITMHVDSKIKTWRMVQDVVLK